MDYYNCLRNQLNCEYAFCNQGICIKKMQEGYAQVEKTVKKEDLVSTERLITVSIFIWRAACTAAAASHGYNAETVSFSFTLLNNAHVDDRLTANAREMLQLQSIRVFDFKITDQKGTLICNGTLP